MSESTPEDRTPEDRTPEEPAPAEPTAAADPVPAELALRGVTVSGRGGATLLDDLDLDVPAGVTTVLCGPAGAGKTAALRVLVGLDVPEAGEVLIDGTDVTRRSPRERDLALVGQEFALHRRLDVHDNLAFATRLRRRHDKVALAQRIDEVAGHLALGHLLDDRPDALDDAQRQRVAIGQGLVRRARATLFDDPFSAQPDRVRSHVRSATLQWQEDAGRTTLVTTARPDEALSIGDRVVVMHRGAVHQVGTPHELRERPADLLVAAYLGEPAMNLLPARVETRASVLHTALGSLRIEDTRRAALGDRDRVVVGVRPERCAPAAAGAGGLEIGGFVEDVEWHGTGRLVHLGVDLDDDEAALLEALEDRLDFDLFQSLFVVAVDADHPVAAGRGARFVVEARHVHLFDAETGARLNGG